jgi:hypothetical protein
VVEITVGWGGELESSEADIVKGFIVNAHDFICIFNQLMDGESSIVGFNDGVWHFRWWDDREGAHDSVWVLLSNFGDQESSHSRAGTTSQRVGDLESLEAVAAFRLFSNYIEDWIYEFSSFCVMALSPVVSGSTLTEDKVVWSEKLTKRSSSDWVHGSWFEVHKDGSGYVSTTSSFVIVDVNSF